MAPAERQHAGSARTGRVGQALVGGVAAALQDAAVAVAAHNDERLDAQ